jgi:predicted O-methyltransferase YrrM
MRPELENLPQPNWFWHGEAILNLIEVHRPLVCVELGTNRGCSAIATARLIRAWGGHLTCVDAWETEQHGASVSMSECCANIKAAGVQQFVSLCQSRIDVAAAARLGQIDYLYIDADHTFDAVTSDLESWWPHLKVGGLIAGDDYDDPADTEVPPNVTRAWDTFEAKHNQAFVRTVTGVQGRLIWGVKR